MNIPVQVLIPGINTVPGPSELYILNTNIIILYNTTVMKKQKQKEEEIFF